MLRAGPVVIALGAIHALLVLVAFAGKLPDWSAPTVTATNYMPLWPLGVIGLPVFGRAESGGWSAPSLLGWGVLAVFCALAWWALVLMVQKRCTAGDRTRPTRSSATMARMVAWPVAPITSLSTSVNAALPFAHAVPPL